MDTVDIFGAPPPGVDLSDDQSGTVLAPIVIVLVLAIVAVALRFTTRHVVEAQRMAADDVFIIFALLFGFGTAGCVFAALSFGCGKHIWVITLDQFKHIQQVVYAAAQIYAATVTCTKTSIVLYYRRIFDFTTTFWVLEFLIVSYFITIVTVMNTGCHPTNYMWMQYVDPNAKGECVDLLKFYYANAIAATLIDIFILITPIYPVWKLQMPTTKKIAVSGIFLLGGVYARSPPPRSPSTDAINQCHRRKHRPHLHPPQNGHHERPILGHLLGSDLDVSRALGRHLQRLPAHPRPVGAPLQRQDLLAPVAELRERHVEWQSSVVFFFLRPSTLFGKVQARPAVRAD
ncbi:hypothetical protein SLS55_008437 [Diplodia seriata]|uniref:Rhodopsin domain-containing protein n=1 Tax=Diplodia seriata TaxID=420778 RepID=A0ABR3C600_9PEZI